MPWGNVLTQWRERVHELQCRVRMRCRLYDGYSSVGQVSVGKVEQGRGCLVLELCRGFLWSVWRREPAKL